MTVETLIGNLSRSDKLLVMELIWRELSNSETTLESPGWHDCVVRERLHNPSATIEAMGLRESFEDIQGLRDAGKAKT